MNTSKIIKGVVSGRYTVTSPIIKEDYGLYLRIEGIELPDTYEVDFSNDDRYGSSVTMIGNSDGVLIPSQCIKSGKDIYAFLYHVGDDYGRTVYKFRIPNKPRPDRTNEEPTPEEQSVIGQAISALNTAVAKTAQDVLDADQSAQSAKDDADRAEEARDAAHSAETNASTYALNAGTKAAESAQSATASAQSASSAASSASMAETKASEAAQSASTASAKAAEANTAKNAAQDAQVAIENMSVSAHTLAEGSSATVTKTEVGGVVNLEFGIPTGEKGEPATDMEIHICSASEYDSTTRVPTIANPNDKTFYLVPTEDGTSPDLFTEWVYVNNAWEMFGSAKIDLSGYLTDVTVDGTSVVTDGVANLPNIPTALKYIKDDASDNGGVIEGTVAGSSTNVASGQASHAEGIYTKATGNYSHSEGASTTASGDYAHAEGGGTTASGINSHAEGSGARATGDQSHAEGSVTAASGNSAHTEGGGTIASATYSHAEGSGTNSVGYASHAEGGGAYSKGDYSHAEGSGTRAIGNQSHAEGSATAASGSSAHAEGSATDASGSSAHAEGGGTTASGVNSHAEGSGTRATGNQSHTEGGGTIASATYSHAEGSGTTASGHNSHAEGSGTVASHKSQHVFGEFNTNDPSTNYPSARGTYVEIVGNGISSSEKSNARTLDWNGNEKLAGSLTLGMNTQDETNISASELKTLKAIKPVDNTLTVEGAPADAKTVGDELTDVKRDLSDKAPVIIETASGSIASFSDGADDMPMQSVVVDIEPVQSGSGDPSPDNVRPISGWTGCEVHRTDGENPHVIDDTYTISWESEAGTVYGGTLDVVSGELVVDRANIASYNGETLPSTWISDRDVYAEGATPTTGAQVVYELSTPQTYQLTPTEVKSILGQNHVWADCGGVEVEYRADTKMFVESQIPDVPVDDVQINGTSIVADGVANVPVASINNFGITKPDNNGLGINSSNSIRILSSSTVYVKNGAATDRAVTLNMQHASTFYGLAKAAGDTTQSQSSNAVGTYTEDAKSAISEMLGGSVSVSGTTPTIVAKAGIRYVCGEVATLDFTPSATGICDVVFTSGATATVLTITGTVKWANGFDPTALDADTTYEINIMDGLGVAVGWT